jgi:hypothetical protein
VKTNAGTAVYLYCVVRATRRPRLARAPAGVPGASAPELHRVAESLWVVSAAVPLEVYGPERLEPRLRNLDWVSELAIAHEAVTEHVARARGTVVVPMKLFTMFSSIDKAVADVAARRRPIARAMRHIGGCEEWGIRVSRRPGATRAGDDGLPRTGAAFLQARKAARDAASAARAETLAAADAAFDRLSRHAKDAHRRERRREPGSNPPVLEAAFLVRAGARNRFKVEARRQASAVANAGGELTLTGPWPAYNFVGPETAA